MTLVLPSMFPLPLLSTTLDSIFTQFQPPNISLMSAPVLTTVAAGLRSALVVDIGWAETVVTSIYDFREVQCLRSVRGSKLYGKAMFEILTKTIQPSVSSDISTNGELGDDIRQVLSFEECEDIISRMGWCKPTKREEPKGASRGLTPVAEEDELRSSMRSLNISSTSDADIVSIPLTSPNPPRTLSIPFSKLAEPCEDAFFGSGKSAQEFDDEELPIHLLVYRSFLQLPVDVRTMCMPRIVFVGGGSNILGLRERILDEVSDLIDERGWDPVRGNAVEQLRNNPKLQQNRQRQVNDGPTEVLSGTNLPASKIKAAFAEQEADPIEEQLKREADKGVKPVELGYLRAVDSLGAWTGGSLLSQLKVQAVSIIDRENWVLHGAAGASREIEVSNNTNIKRQSMGPATTFKSAAGDRSSWTLGLWG
jgi:actin-related protein